MMYGEDEQEEDHSSAGEAECYRFAEVDYSNQPFLFLSRGKWEVDAINIMQKADLIWL